VVIIASRVGFFAFTVGTVLLTALELRWVPAPQTPQIAVLVLAFVVPLEALSGLFAFLARDSGAATGLTMLSAAWSATAINLLHGPPGALSLPLAIFLLTLTALLLEESYQRMVLPLGRRGRARFPWKAASRTRCARRSRSRGYDANCDKGRLPASSDGAYLAMPEKWPDGRAAQLTAGGDSGAERAVVPQADAEPAAAPVPECGLRSWVGTH
jgi:hypothetical protein